MIYYRIATQKHQSTEWEWKSTPVHSLEAVFQLGRQYDCMPAEHVRVFAASAVEYMDILLVRANLGLPANSLTLEQLLHDHQSITTPHVRHFEMQLGWQEGVEDQQTPSMLEPESETPDDAELDLIPVAALERSADADSVPDPESWGSDHDKPYTFAFPEYTPHALAWIKLRARVLAGELVS